MICPDCGKEHTRANLDRSAGFKWRCPDCSAKRVAEMYKRNRASRLASQKRWASKNPEWVKENSRRQSLRRKYGITLEEFYNKVESQGGCCLICGVYGKKLMVDHDHKTGRIRGIICHNCNMVIGHGKESVEILQKVIKYLS